MKTENPNFLDRLRAEVAFANQAAKEDLCPVMDSSLTYGDLREMLAILSEVCGPLSDDDMKKIDWAWEQHKAAKPKDDVSSVSVERAPRRHLQSTATVAKRPVERTRLSQAEGRKLAEFLLPWRILCQRN